MPSDKYQAGLAIRHDMFGAGVTDSQINAASPFLRQMQDIVTENCFGEVWTRPGLDRRTRSLLTIAMLIGLGRSHEIRIHVKGALSNGATEEELGELLRHAAVYCGVPAAVDAFINTDAVLREQAATGASA